MTFPFCPGPRPVTNLTEGEVTTESVTLLWQQQESKPHYSYVVQVSNGSAFTVSNTSHKFTGLVPGSSYSFTVTTQTADGTSATPVTVSLYTRTYLNSCLTCRPRSKCNESIRLIGVVSNPHFWWLKTVNISVLPLHTNRAGDGATQYFQS